MARIKFEFPNKEGQILAGLLETPKSETPRCYALFAHCFTCGKDIAAASRISRALADRGIAVLRFDFTGLGNSDGDFANTNFSSNVEDLIYAAKALQTTYQAPRLIIGHSLGGAAVLSAAPQIPEIQAVVTIAAPSTAEHVQHLFAQALPTLEQESEAKVKIGRREFTVKKQLVDDLNQYNSRTHISQLNKALLVFHSPVDSIVSIDEAAKIYQAAKHPKSFISLDAADHLLSHRDDSEYVAATLSAWASRYLDLSTATHETNHGSAPSVAAGEVLTTELDKKFLRGLFTQNHQLKADEPVSYGGGDLGPTPYDLLLMGLGACTSMTIRMYAERKKIDLTDVQIRLVHERTHADDCSDCGEREGKLEKITRYIRLQGNLTDEERQGLMRIADRCPVHRTLENDPVIVSYEERS